MISRNRINSRILLWCMQSQHQQDPQDNPLSSAFRDNLYWLLHTWDFLQDESMVTIFYRTNKADKAKDTTKLFLIRVLGTTSKISWRVWSSLWISSNKTTQSGYYGANRISVGRVWTGPKYMVSEGNLELCTDVRGLNCRWANVDRKGWLCFLDSCFT